MRDDSVMHNLRARWLGVAAVCLAFAGAAAAAWFTYYLSHRGLDWAAKFSEIASFVLAACGVLVPVASKFARWLPAPRLKDEQVESDVAGLAAALRVQGRLDRAVSGLYVYDRLPMPVRWQPSIEQSPGLHTSQADPGPAADPDPASGTFDDVLDYFRGLSESRLLVLGEAGAGKTVLVTELARRLLAARQPTDPVPVIIPVTAWDPRQASLFDWVSEQLIRINSDLAQRVSDGRGFVTRAQALVDRMRVLPILDGLDEVVEVARPLATLAINRYG